MKCPKCGYLGFEHVDRCRNCGYDFSLTSPAAAPDLSIRPDSAVESPLDDLSFLDSTRGQDGSRTVTVTPDLHGVLGAPVSAKSAKSAYSAAGELPLFGAIPGDEPLITKASPPRAPLAVRRATLDVSRVRVEPPRPASLDLSLESEPGPSMHAPLHPATRATTDSWSRGDTDEAAEDAAVSARVIAVVIDLLILAVIDAIVIYFTMQICGITLDEINVLPKAPLLAFLFVQNGGYLVAFTAGGQTLGKMAAGIRVVPADADATLDVGRAFLRTLIWLVLAVPAGLGFLTAFLNRDRRGLHDRFAGTRVVR
jgi:uncharacterized RDD family membrane protein YckC